MAKILIIDDDQDIVESLTVVLQNYNYKVVSALRGDEGLDKIHKEHPDLIILDVIMETGDKGFDIARKLKNDDTYKNIPILMLTAIKSRTGMDFKKEAGDEVWLPVDDYCDKPIKPDELIAKVKHLLQKK